MPRTIAIQASLLIEDAAWNEDHNCRPGSILALLNGTQGTEVIPEGDTQLLGGSSLESILCADRGQISMGHP